jgi:hypothetical protein
METAKTAADRRRKNPCQTVKAAPVNDGERQGRPVASANGDIRDIVCQ